MKYIYFAVLFPCMLVGCWDLRRIPSCEDLNSDGSVSTRIWIEKDGRVPAECVELKSLPYLEQPRKCFGGKSCYNSELALSRIGMICPFGPVTRTKVDGDLPSYSTTVKVPFERTIQTVRFYSNTIYERANDRVVVLSLTIENMMDWEKRFVRVDEIPPDKYAESINKELEEQESIIVFNKQGIYVKSSGDKKFRGYLFGLPEAEFTN